MRDADMILWVGISFQQSASTAYFRRVRGYLQVGASFASDEDHEISQHADCNRSLAERLLACQGSQLNSAC